MKTFLYILGGCFIFGVVLLLGLRIYLKLKYKGLENLISDRMSDLANQIEGMSALSQMMEMSAKMRIELTEIQNTDWGEEDQALVKTANQYVSELHELGFEKSGHYKTDIEGLYLTGFTHPDEKIMACVFKLPENAPYIDLFALTTDGRILTVTNSPDTALNKPDLATRIHLIEKSAKELYEQALEASHSLGEFETYNAGKFELGYQKAFAIQMDWRVAQGGYQAEEIQCVLQDQSPEPELIDMILESANQALAENVEWIMLEELSKKIETPVDELDKIGYHILFIHPMTEDYKVGYCMSAIAGPEHDEDDDTLSERFESLIEKHDLHTVVKTMIGELPDGKKVQYHGTVDTPVEAHVYQFPHEEKAETAEAAEVAGR